MITPLSLEYSSRRACDCERGRASEKNHACADTGAVLLLSAIVIPKHGKETTKTHTEYTYIINSWKRGPSCMTASMGWRLVESNDYHDINGIAKRFSTWSLSFAQLYIMEDAFCDSIVLIINCRIYDRWTEKVLSCGLKITFGVPDSKLGTIFANISLLSSWKSVINVCLVFYELYILNTTIIFLYSSTAMWIWTHNSLL